MRRVHRDALLTSPMALAVVGPRMPAGLNATGHAPPAAGTPRPPVLPGPARPAGPAWPDAFAWVAVGAAPPP
ncbi:hypothetical protein ACFQ2B_32660 [Streptomyces stramineus]